MPDSTDNKEQPKKEYGAPTVDDIETERRRMMMGALLRLGDALLTPGSAAALEASSLSEVFKNLHRGSPRQSRAPKR